MTECPFWLGQLSVSHLLSRLVAATEFITPDPEGPALGHSWLLEARQLPPQLGHRALYPSLLLLQSPPDGFYSERFFDVLKLF